MSALALFRHPVSRVLSGRARWLPVLAWSALAILVAVLSRRQDHAVYVALSRGFGAVSMPLVVFAVFGLVCPEGTVVAAARPLVFLGAPARRAAVSIMLTVALVSAVVCAALGAAVVAIAHGPKDPSLGADLLTTAAVGALGGAAYAGYFSFGSAYFGAHARGIFLVMDVMLGGFGVGAVLTPRAHVRALFGGDLAGRLSPRGSYLALAVMLVLFLLLSTLRSRSRR